MKLKTEVTCTNNPLPESDYSRLSRRVDSINTRVTDITPYEESKMAYIGDTECAFEQVKDGMINVSINDNPCDFEVLNGQIIARFEPLTEAATVNISIQ